MQQTSSPTPPSTPAKATGSATASNATVLLVDDLRLNRVVLSRMLAKLGFDVLEADNGLSAIQTFCSHRASISCILLDLQMPILDGWRTAARLRQLEADSAWRRTPIVACTALEPAGAWGESGASVAASAQQAGVDELLEKMPTMLQLFEVLRRHVTGLMEALPQADGEIPSQLAQVSA